MKKLFIFSSLIVGAINAIAQDPAYPSAPSAPANIVSAEYWIDTDPGFGNGTAISVSAGVNVNNSLATLNTSGLSNGIHRFAIRSKNANGKWSLTAFREFLVDSNPAYPSASSAASNIVSAEYWVDTDPGFGNGTAITVTAGVNVNNIVAALNTSGLSNGIHRFALRSKNANGTWSHATFREFLVDSNPAYPFSPSATTNMVAAEYFIDTDPGFGSGTAIALTANVNVPNIIVPINTTGLSTGSHYLVIRSKNSNGAWSLSTLHSFIVNTDFSYPPAPPSPGNITLVEYFFDTDPGFGNGTAINITPGVDISNITFSADVSALNDSTHTLFIRSLDDWSITNFVSFSKGAPLPLDFIAFTAVASGDDVLLNWQTANEVNAAHFDIEYSNDGFVFNKIAEQTAENSGGNHSYNYVHRAPGDGNLFYRIRQVDIDGQSKYSVVRLVKMDKAQQSRIIIYPNPARDIITLKNINVDDIVAVQFSDMNGKTMIPSKLSGASQYNISNWSAGTYIVKVQKKDGTSMSRTFVK